MASRIWKIIATIKGEVSMTNRKNISGAVGKGCAGLFAAALCCVGGALPAFAADTTPAPDPVPTVKPNPKPAPDPVVPPKPEPKPDPKPEPKPDPKPDPKPEPKPEPKPADTTPNVSPAAPGNNGTKPAQKLVTNPNYVTPGGSGGFTQTQSVSGQGELAKTGALAMTGGLCALALVAGGGGTILVRKLRGNTPETLTSTPGVGSNN